MYLHIFPHEGESRCVDILPKVNFRAWVVLVVVHQTEARWDAPGDKRRVGRGGWGLGETRTGERQFVPLGL